MCNLFYVIYMGDLNFIHAYHRVVHIYHVACMVPLLSILLIVPFSLIGVLCLPSWFSSGRLRRLKICQDTFCLLGVSVCLGVSKVWSVLLSNRRGLVLTG